MKKWIVFLPVIFLIGIVVAVLEVDLADVPGNNTFIQVQTLINDTNISILHGTDGTSIKTLATTSEGVLRLSIQAMDGISFTNVSVLYGYNGVQSIPILTTTEGVLRTSISAITSDVWKIENDIIYPVTPRDMIIQGNLNVTKNLNITGCISYNGGTLGNCI